MRQQSHNLPEPIRLVAGNRSLAADTAVLDVAGITSFLQELAPLSLAENWDNVGLLVGSDEAVVSNVMTCLTLTPDLASEAMRRQAQLVVSHHPLLFRPVQRLTAETPEGRMLLELISAGINVYSPHTSYDSAASGINQQLAELLELTEIDVLRPFTDASCSNIAESAATGVGSGRFGRLPAEMNLRQFNELVKVRLQVEQLQFVGDAAANVEQVGVACGSAAEFLSDARDKGCQVLLTGEARFHACLQAQASEIALVLPGHYATERPAMEHLAECLADRFPQLTVWASESESDPVKWC